MKKLLLFTILFLAFSLPALASELPSALLQPYLNAQVLLSTDEMKGLADAANEVETAASSLGKDADALVSSAKKLAAAKNISDARNAFGQLSEAMVAYADKTKATLPADLHVAYCPMEDKPWMQKGKEIKNPYYGASMISCGVIKK